MKTARSLEPPTSSRHIQRDGDASLYVGPVFVPYVSKLPGVAHRRGVLYNIDQDIRTISFTRL